MPTMSQYDSANCHPAAIQPLIPVKTQLKESTLNSVVRQSDHLPWLAPWLQNYPQPPILPFDARRCEVVDSYHVLDSEEENTLNELCHIACSLFDVAFAAINIVARDRVWFKAVDNNHPPLNGMKEAPRCVSLCNYTIAHGESFVVGDMSRVDDFKYNPLVTSMGCRFYGGAPLTTHDGFHIGTFCLLDPKPRYNFSATEQATLDLLATTAMRHLEVRKMAVEQNAISHKFLTNISHDMRTPIHAISGLCELLQDLNSEPAAASSSSVPPLSTSTSSPLSSSPLSVQLEYIQEIRRQAKQLLMQTNTLMSFHQVQVDTAGHGRITESQQSFRLSDLLETICSDSQVKADVRDSPIELDNKCPPTMECIGDPARISQVMTSLLSYVLKGSRKTAAVHITCSLSLEAPRSMLSYTHTQQHDVTRTSASSSSPLFFLSFDVAFDGTFNQNLFRSVSTSNGEMNVSLVRQSSLVDQLADNDLGLWLAAQLARGMNGDCYSYTNKSGQTSLVAVVQLHVDPATQIASKTQTPVLPQRVLVTKRKSLERKSLSAASTSSVVSPSTQLPSPADNSAEPSPLANGPFSCPAGTRRLTRQFTLRVLIVDDNIINLKIAQRMLELDGHRCVMVESGQAALTAVETESFDVILMDLQMPEMDGLETTRLIRTMESEGKTYTATTSPKRFIPRIPIIALTATAKVGAREMCLSAGMDGFVTKPFQRKQVQNIMYEIIQRYKQIDEEEQEEEEQENNHIVITDILPNTTNTSTVLV